MNYSDEMDRIMSIVLYREDEVKDLKDEEVPQGCVFVRGLAHNFGFHPGRLLDSAEDVRKILGAVVTDEFMGGRGWLELPESRRRTQRRNLGQPGRRRRSDVPGAGSRVGRDPGTALDVADDARRRALRALQLHR